MKKFFFSAAIAAMFAFILGITSCSQDKCANVVCQNGGTCQNGNCSCPAGYTGSMCETTVTPTQMAITQIAVNGFPALNSSGNDWNAGGTGQSDASGYANIYIVVQDAAGNVLYNFSQNPVIYAAYQSSYTFTPSSPIILSNPTGSYNIILYNSVAGCASCTGSDAPMGNVFWTPFTVGQSGFPVTVTATGGGVSYQLTLSYTH